LVRGARSSGNGRDQDEVNQVLRARRRDHAEAQPREIYISRDVVRGRPGACWTVRGASLGELACRDAGPGPARDHEAGGRCARGHGHEQGAESGAPVAPPVQGHIAVRIPPEQHRELAVEAAEQSVSLNRLISKKLSA
jgi:hypothetical protein